MRFFHFYMLGNPEGLGFDALGRGVHESVLGPLRAHLERLGVVVDQVLEAMRVDTRTIGRAADPDPVIPVEWIAGNIARPGRQILVLHGARLRDAAGPAVRKEAGV